MSAFYVFMYIVSFLFLLLAAAALLLTPIMFITFIILLCRKKKSKKAFGIISVILPNLILPLLVLFFVTFPTTWCNHQYEIIEQVEATCTEKGFIKKQCKKCDASKEEEIEALSHSFVVEKTEEATCSHPKQVHKKCTVCNYKEIEKIGEPSHSLVVERTEEATCTNPKQVHKKCTVCSHKEIEKIGEPLPHSYGEWVVEKTATSESCGQKSKTCSVCQHKVTEEIPKNKDQTLYAQDYVVNRFITEFNNGIGYDFTNIKKGNIRTKYFAYANECYVEIINANDAGAKCFSVSINGGRELSDRDRMFAVFKQVVKTLDKSITDAQINSAIEYLESQQYMVRDYKISNSVTVETYLPIVEQSYGKSACRIDVISSNYK